MKSSLDIFDYVSLCVSLLSLAFSLLLSLFLLLYLFFLHFVKNHISHIERVGGGDGEIFLLPRYLF